MGCPLGSLLMTACLLAADPTAPAEPEQGAVAPISAPLGAEWQSISETEAPPAGLFAGDHAFDGFIGPVTNPVLAKDPRVFTETRLIFINDKVPGNHPVLPGEDVQVYAIALRLALTERLGIIADKSGAVVANDDVYGWNNLAAGFKYELIRNPEQQFLLTTGLMYEMPTGQPRAFQGVGSGVFTAFGTVGKEFAGETHLLTTLGYQFPAVTDDNSQFGYLSMHLDRRLWGWVYPLFEMNWFHYTAGGDRGIPPIVGEGDGLLNFGTSGVAGNDLVTLAVGLALKRGPHSELSGAWEFPVSNRKDLIDHRLTLGLTLRY